jgi:protein-S-isoprenylcysteine O-methyltransferase Ste14
MSAPELILYVVWLMWAISWVAAAGWSAKTIKRPPVAGEIRYRFATLAGYAFLFVLYTGYLHGPLRLWTTSHRTGWTMVGLTLLCFAFAWWARVHLGTLWSSRVTRKSDHRIVDSGPYRIVRHPIYTALIVAAFCLAVTKGTLPAFLGAGLLAYGYWLKAKIEEDFLRAELGADAYESYSARVGMLVPFIH